MTSIEAAIQKATNLIHGSGGLLITAGAGMGVDSGLPDFRGPQGFWGAYPALGRAQLHFEGIANPQAFHEHPRLAWGFYGHRLNLYRTTQPGESFRLLLAIAESLPSGAYAFTSNVDGHFQKGGFPSNRVCEVHGSIHHLQCLEGCREAVWSASGFEPVINAEDCLLTGDLPYCPYCGGLARPNILMFGDWGWLDQRQRQQMLAMQDWLSQVRNPIVIEIGAGTSIATVRHFGEKLGCPLLRINRKESEVSRLGDVAITMDGREALRRIAHTLGLKENAPKPS